MSEVVRVADVLTRQEPGRLPRVTVRGWIRTRRDSKAGLSFLNVHDGSAFAPLQVVAQSTLPNYVDEILHLTAGCAVVATGTLAESQGKGQTVELQASLDRGRRLGRRSRHVPGRGEAPHLRVPTRGAAPARAHEHDRRGRARAHQRWRRPFTATSTSNGFYWIHTPIISASDAEGAGEMFRVSTLDLANLPRTAPPARSTSAKDFFGRPTFLTVSGQLNVESYCLAMTNVYTFGPTFRAENSNTSRHLSEFWMVEPEIAFADLSDDADLAEDLLKYGLPRRPRRARGRHGLLRRAHRPRGRPSSASGGVRRLRLRADDVHRGGGHPGPPPVASGSSTVKLGRQPPGGARALPLRGARRSGRWSWSITPRTIKAFYMRLNDDDRTVAAMDVLAPGMGEIVGGSQREERLDVLDRPHRRDAGLDVEPTMAGIATCAATAPCRTPGSVSASTGRSLTRRGWPTSATSSPSLGRREGAEF